MTNEANHEYDIALSFAGEDREYIEKTAEYLLRFGYRVFYDKYETANLWGKNLYTHLRDIYLRKAKYTVMFISKNYRDKLWTNHERESAQARAFSEKEEYILPARFDDTEVPGLLPTVSYINLAKYTPKEFADIIKIKVGRVDRQEFFPYQPLDRLYDFMGVENEDDKKYIYSSSLDLFEVLKHTTPDERFILFHSAMNTPEESLPDSIIIKLGFLSRLTGLDKTHILNIFDRLEDLYIYGGIIEKNEKNNKKEEYIEIIIETSNEDYKENITGVFTAIIHFLSSHRCPDCVEKSLEILDFSELSSITGFEKEC